MFNSLQECKKFMRYLKLELKENRIISFYIVAVRLYYVNIGWIFRMRPKCLCKYKY